MGKKFSETSLFWKMFLGISLIICIGGATSFTILDRSNKSRDFLNNLYTYNFKFIFQLSEFHQIYQGHQLLILHHLAAESTTAMDAIRAELLLNQNKMLELIKRHEKAHRDYEERHHDIEHEIQRYVTLSSRVVELSEDFEKEQAFMVFQSQVAPLAKEITALSHEEIKGVEGSLGAYFQEAVQSHAHTTILVVFALLFSGGISFFLAFFIASKISRQIQHLVSYAQEVGNGNFAAKIPFKGEDEFGLLSQNLQTMADKLLELFQNQRRINTELEGEIEERKAVERRLEESRQYYQDFVEGTDDLVTQVDTQGRFTYVNHMAEQIFGLKSKECLGKSAFDFVHPEDRQETSEAFQGWLDAKKSFATFENRQVSVTGTVRYVLWSVNLHYNDEHILTKINSIAVDISERKEYEMLLVEAKDTAEKANQLKSEFLANMSHELRTPLNSIIGFSELMQLKIGGPLTEEQQDYISEILTSGRHLLTLINEMLDLARSEAGKMELILQKFNLGELLEICLYKMKKKALEQQIELQADITEEDGFYIEADQDKIRQVVHNLLDNAVKFTPDGGRVGIKSEKKDDEIQVSVWDTGIGLSAEDTSHLFQQFTQLEHHLNKQFAGTGIGLRLSKQLVELHGGRIWAESEGEGKGSRFIFSLPGAVIKASADQ